MYPFTKLQSTLGASDFGTNFPRQVRMKRILKK